MAMTAENTVADVEVRIIKKGTVDERQIYDVVDSNGIKWTAWEKDLAERAWKLKNEVSVWTVEITKNGKYENRTLKDIQPRLQNGMEAIGTTFNPTQTESTSSSNSTTSFNPKPADNKDASICRQTAGKVAAAISTNPAEFWANVQDLTHYFLTGETPNGDNSPGFSSQITKDDDLPF